MKFRNVLAVVLAAVLTFGVTYGAIAQSAVPPTPAYHSPANGAVYQEGQTVKLVWYGKSGRHFVQLSGPNGVVEYSAGQSSYLNLNGLAVGNYTWQVQSRNSAGSSEWSSPRSFSVAIAAPKYHSPADGAVFQEGQTVKLTWYGVQGRHSVNLTGPSQSGVHSTGQTSYLNLSGLAPGTYTWQVRSSTNTVPGIWSTPRTFTVVGS